MTIKNKTLILLKIGNLKLLTENSTVLYYPINLDSRYLRTSNKFRGKFLRNLNGVSQDFILHSYSTPPHFKSQPPLPIGVQKTPIFHHPLIGNSRPVVSQRWESRKAKTQVQKRQKAALRRQRPPNHQGQGPVPQCSA